MPFIEIEINLDQFEDQDLIRELEGRGYNVSVKDQFLEEDYDYLCEELEKVHILRESGKDYQDALNEIFSKFLGLQL